MKYFYIFLAALLILAGCDDGSGASGVTTKTLYSTASLDGQVSSAGSVITTGETIDVGDNASNQELRGFYSFDVSGIAPATTEDFKIRRAILKLTMTDWFDNPVENLDSVVVELVEYGTSLESGDFSVTSIGEWVVLATDNVMLTDYEADMTSRIQDYLTSGDSESLVRWQFRIRHSGESSDGNDTASFTRWATRDYVNGDIYQPTLTVTF